MRKTGLVAITIFAATACTTSLAASQDGFFLGANLGRAEYRGSGPVTDAFRGTSYDRHDVAYGLRFGYTWSGPVDFGIETGYVDLGSIEGKSSGFGGLAYPYAYQQRNTLGVRALTLGAHGKYRFGADPPWFVSARGGVMRNRVDFKESTKYTYLPTPVPGAAPPGSTGTSTVSNSHTGTSWYAGAGIGYDITANLALSLTYDLYKVKATVADSRYLDSSLKYQHSVALYSLYAEYRF